MTSARSHILIAAILVGSSIGCRSGTQRGTDRGPSGAQETEISKTCDLLRVHLTALGLASKQAAVDGGCRIECSASLDTLHLEVDPLDVLRDSMIESGWTEAVEFMADGAGTSSYRVVRGSKYCQVYGGAPAWIDDDEEIRQSNDYYLNVECHSEP
ncbi:MAG: hypothetical protein WBW88_12515 [Rhodothermales bacterium]